MLEYRLPSWRRRRQRSSRGKNRRAVSRRSWQKRVFPRTPRSQLQHLIHFRNKLKETGCPKPPLRSHVANPHPVDEDLALLAAGPEDLGLETSRAVIEAKIEGGGAVVPRIANDGGDTTKRITRNQKV